jgi:hypothetical protein
MPSSAMAAIGTLLQIGDGGAPEAFTTISEVRDISGPSLSADSADVTTHDSAGDFEESVPTILRTGEVTFAINFIPSNATHSAGTGLLADYSAKTQRHWQLVIPHSGGTVTWSFTGFVSNFNPSFNLADQVGADVGIKVSGLPTLA